MFKQYFSIPKLNSFHPVYFKRNPNRRGWSVCNVLRGGTIILCHTENLGMWERFRIKGRGCHQRSWETMNSFRKEIGFFNAQFNIENECKYLT